jgi:hypothetical protein
VLENPAELSRWAQRSFEIQVHKKDKPGKRHAKNA